MIEAVTNKNREMMINGVDWGYIHELNISCQSGVGVTCDRYSVESGLMI
jgi:hypothetical protein